MIVLRAIMQSDSMGTECINVRPLEKNVAKYGYAGINRAIKRRRFI
jgi:hypothetical protein